MTYEQSLTALADPTRRRLFERLLKRPHAVGDLARSLHVSQPAVSQQLARLRESGIVEFRRDGKTVYYRIASARIEHFLPLLQQHFPID